MAQFGNTENKLTKIVRIPPLMPNLQIMVIDDQTHKPIQQSPALLLRQPDDALDMMPHCEDGLPACDRVRANDGMDGAELRADVLGGAARRCVQLEAVGVSGFVEAGLGVGCGEGF
jgi:hypothetical protein